MVYTDADGNVTVYNMGDIAWILTSMALVWLMVPGVGFFYSGLLRRKNALSMIYMGVMVLAVVSFQVSLTHVCPLNVVSHVLSSSGSFGDFRWHSARPEARTLVT